MHSESTLVSVVIGSYNRKNFLEACISSVRAELHDIAHEIIIVDGGSIDGTVAWLTKQKDIITIVQHNRGEWQGEQIERKSWGYFMNLGFRAASGKYVCMLSDDCLVVPGAIKNGLKKAEKKKLGMVAFYWRNWPDQTDYWVGIAWGNRMFVNHGLYLREALEKVDFIDADNFFFYHADGDLALRIWDAGYTCEASNTSFIEHRSDANVLVRESNLKSQKKDWALYEKRWKYLGDSKQDWLYKRHDDVYNTANNYWSPIDKPKKRLGLWRKDS